MSDNDKEQHMHIRLFYIFDFWKAIGEYQGITSYWLAAAQLLLSVSAIPNTYTYTAGWLLLVLAVTILILIL